MENKTYWVLKDKLSDEYAREDSCGCCITLVPKNERTKYHNYALAKEACNAHSDFTIVRVTVRAKSKPKKPYYIVEGYGRDNTNNVDEEGECWIGFDDDGIVIDFERKFAAKFDSLEEANQAILDAVAIKEYDCSVYWLKPVAIVK